MNLLTLSAAFGVLVLIFQDGRFQDLLQYNKPGSARINAAGAPIRDRVRPLNRLRRLPAHPNQRITRRRRAEQGSGSPGAAAHRANHTAAALLFCVAIGAFATSQIIFIKELGIGIAAGVLVDATIVRAFLVPSLMALLGSWNWWAPRPLRWVYRAQG